jgi:hypothetical protein
LCFEVDGRPAEREHEDHTQQQDAELRGVSLSDTVGE